MAYPYYKNHLDVGGITESLLGLDIKDGGDPRNFDESVQDHESIEYNYPPPDEDDNEHRENDYREERMVELRIERAIEIRRKKEEERMEERRMEERRMEKRRMEKRRMEENRKNRAAEKQEAKN